MNKDINSRNGHKRPSATVGGVALMMTRRKGKCKMYKYSFTNNGKTWERITKKQARAAYNNGLTVMFCPVYVRPFTPWHLEIDVNKNFECYNGVSFEKAVNAFEMYNCNCNETGRYTAFYIPVEIKRK